MMIKNDILNIFSERRETIPSNMFCQEPRFNWRKLQVVITFIIFKLAFRNLFGLNYLD